MQTPFKEEEIAFDGFGALMGLGFPVPGGPACDSMLVPMEAMPSGVPTFYNNRWMEVRRETPGGPFYVADARKELFRARRVMLHHVAWYTTLVMACLHAIQRGEQFVLCHCGLLETSKGGILLFGESGVGKSTACARWRAEGGRCISDDMALMDFSDPDQVFLRRMPTWSACREGRKEWDYPCTEEIPLFGVLALGRTRSGHDEIEPLSFGQYFAQCYRSMFYWTLPFAKCLDATEQDAITSTVRGFTQRITGMFPYAALRTSLEGELTPVIEKYLQTR